MNPNTGHLIADMDDTNMLERLKHRMADYERIPANLAQEAVRKLRGQPEAQVNLMSRTPLAVWAKKKRLEKIAAKSRRRNRK
jgi:hypothetical protein